MNELIEKFCMSQIILRSAFIEKYKLPPNGFYKFPNNTEIPYIDPEKIINFINSLLSEIEGLRGSYSENKFMWELEWGTKPIELTVSDYKIRCIIEHKKFCALQAQTLALEKFPHLIENNDDDDEFEPPQFNSGWCKTNIILSYNEKENKITIEYNRLSGDSLTFYDIVRPIIDKLNEDTFKKWIYAETLWEKRKNIIQLMKILIDSKIDNHINQILRNEYYIRDICSYL